MWIFGPYFKNCLLYFMKFKMTSFFYIVWHRCEEHVKHFWAFRKYLKCAFDLFEKYFFLLKYVKNVFDWNLDLNQKVTLLNNHMTGSHANKTALLVSNEFNHLSFFFTSIKFFFFLNAVIRTEKSVKAIRPSPRTQIWERSVYQSTQPVPSAVTLNQFWHSCHFSWPWRDFHWPGPSY